MEKAPYKQYGMAQPAYKLSFRLWRSLYQREFHVCVKGVQWEVPLGCILIEEQKNLIDQSLETSCQDSTGYDGISKAFFEGKKATDF